MKQKEVRNTRTITHGCIAKHAALPMLPPPSPVIFCLTYLLLVNAEQNLPAETENKTWSNLQTLWIGTSYHHPPATQLWSHWFWWHPSATSFTTRQKRQNITTEGTVSSYEPSVIVWYTYVKKGNRDPDLYRRKTSETTDRSSTRAFFCMISSSFCGSTSLSRPVWACSSSTWTCLIFSWLSRICITKHTTDIIHSTRWLPQGSTMTTIILV